MSKQDNALWVRQAVLRRLGPTEADRIDRKAAVIVARALKQAKGKRDGREFAG